MKASELRMRRAFDPNCDDLTKAPVVHAGELAQMPEANVVDRSRRCGLWVDQRIEGADHLLKLLVPAPRLKLLAQDCRPHDLVPVVAVLLGRCCHLYHQKAYGLCAHVVFH